MLYWTMFVFNLILTLIFSLITAWGVLVVGEINGAWEAAFIGGGFLAILASRASGNSEISWLVLGSVFAGNIYAILGHI